MKHALQLCSVMFLFLVAVSTSQAQWQCLYATWDDGDSNGTGHQVPSVGVIRENMFVALVGTPGARNFLIPYVNADSSHGRKYSYGYGTTPTANRFQLWTDGAFDQVQMYNAFHITATPDSFIYVPNNDPDHNILVFKYVKDTITVVPIGSVYPRQMTGTNGVFGIDVDRSGYVYVCNDTTTGVTTDVKIYKPIRQWSATHDDAPLKTIDLPNGIYKGIAVSPDGKQLFVSDYGNRKILKYVGSPTTGYTLDTRFNWAFGPADSIAGSTAKPNLLGLHYLSPNNILFAASDSWGTSSSVWTYQYGRIYLLNANTGAMISADSSVSVIDQAKWNFNKRGDSTFYRDNTGKIPGNVSGYTTTYDVKFDEKGFVYSQSNNGWCVEKWRYVGTLPVITSVEEIEGPVPESYQLRQNYPNPLNPTTTIEFSLLSSGIVTLKVCNVLGQEVATLVNEEKDAGTYRVTFDARDLPSGTYFYTIRSGNFSEMKKMLVLK